MLEGLGFGVPLKGSKYKGSFKGYIGVQGFGFRAV